MPDKALTVVPGDRGRLMAIQDVFRSQMLGLSIELENATAEILGTVSSTVELTRAVLEAVKANHAEQARVLSEFLPEAGSRAARRNDTAKDSIRPEK